MHNLLKAIDQGEAKRADTESGKDKDHCRGTCLPKSGVREGKRGDVHMGPLQSQSY